MALRVVGAGLGRTGTNSLKLALEQLLEGRCYHMYELFGRPRDLRAWEAAVREEPVDWGELLGDYVAAVDWPAAAFWRELHAANPEAFVLLSTRESAETWWGSMEKTIVPTVTGPLPEDPDAKRGRAMVLEMMRRRFTARLSDRDAAIAAYERHNDEVRRTVSPELLIEWQPSDGWEPICAALGLAAPPVPFPHENTTAAFRATVGAPRPAELS
jgi:hypothetical protein